MSHYLGNHTALCQTKYGHKIFVDTRDNSLAPHILVQGDWEPWISQAMFPFLQGAAFYDVGANIGWYSLLAEKAGAKRVTAFEPNPVLCNLLWRTMNVNGFVWDMKRFALSDTTETLTLRVHWVLAGGASIGEETPIPVAGEDGFENFQVAVREFDKEFLPDQGTSGSPIVMKFDVEGHEPKALLGAKEFIRHNSPTIFFEYHPDPHNLKRLHDALEFLQSERYQVAHVGIDAKLHPIDYSGIASVPSTDMLAFRKMGR